MSTFQQDLRTFITASTSITDRVSTRVHYNQVPQSSVRPHLWYRVSSDVEERTFDGAGGLHDASVDLECAALTETAAQGLADDIKTRLDGYKGAVGNITARGIFCRDKDDDYEAKLNQSDEGVHVVAFDVQCFYTT